ncbi:DUF4382 domain-containing protein [Chitinophaga polysaccharea]|uniref:DUF4382 domain-containing protein n=1 Tax=Chitinophaga TaxID=79328 RepID=UPI001455AF92|nr:MULTISPECIES: DUF4382 domain-containing protein [Chitinophaga]NLR57560.1 DUF4382 domain-containing protein [Chitinophaga polysaccharea]NLU95474.1 DUF4382 domain-containing protein [Chitinophaga sp. Ak27]
MKNQILGALALMAVTAFSLTSCSKSSDSSSGNSKMSVYLTDAPSPYDAVWVDIQDVQVNASTDASASTGWQSIHILRPGVYNLLQFRNGVDTLLASQDLPAGAINQIRLVLGSNNSVVIDGTSHPLETPSAQQSGLKLNINATLVAGVEYRLWLDFDANRSVVVTGNNKYILKPVIRSYTQATSGAIKGIALPLLGVKGVFAIQNTDTIASAIPDAATGAFLLSGLNAGAYNVAFSGNTIVKDTTLLGVNVTVGQSTNLGTIQLH